MGIFLSLAPTKKGTTAVWGTSYFRAVTVLLAMAAAAVVAVLILCVLMLDATEASAQGKDKPQFTSTCIWSHTNLGDPIAHPAQPHKHAHMGNDTTDTDSTLSSLLADPPELSRIPSLPQCDRSSNKSAYWSPLISWGGMPVTPYRVGAYYVALSEAKQTQTIPRGFEMIAYSKAATTRSDGEPLDNGARAKLYWHCDAEKNVQESMREGEPSPPSSCNGADPTLGLTIVFPQCWDGGPFDVVGGANMRHAVNGACPKGFPVRLPSLHMLLDYILPQNEGPLKILGHNGVEEDASVMHADYKNAEDQRNLTLACIRRAEDRKTPPFCRHGDNKVLTPENLPPSTRPEDNRQDPIQTDSQRISTAEE